MMFRRFPICLMLTVFALPLMAQGEPEAKKSKEEMTREEGRKPSGHVSVEVILKNEGVFLGVARKGCLVEKSVRHQYVALPAEKQADFGAGIRVWYYDDLLGFLFIPYRQIDQVKVGDELTNEQLERLKAKVEERRLAKEAARQDDGKSKEKASAKKADSEPVQSELLTQFPPSEGYTPDRFAELQRGSITGDLVLSEQESAWSKVYPDWLKAYRAAEEAAKAPKTPDVAKKKDGPKPEVKTDGTLIGVTTKKGEGQSSGGDDIGRGLK